MIEPRSTEPCSTEPCSTEPRATRRLRSRPPGTLSMLLALALVLPALLAPAPRATAGRGGAGEGATTGPGQPVVDEVETQATGKWLLFPDEQLYEPYLADPQRIVFAMEGIQADSGIVDVGKSRFGLRAGGDFGVVRSRPADPDARRWQVNFQGSLDAQFDAEQSLDNVGWDGNFGASLTSRRPGGAWAFKVGVFHTSAHIGDEIIERTGRRRIGYTREELELAVQHHFDRRWRGYFEVGYGFTNNADDGSQDPPRAQLGWVYESPRTLWDGRMGWYWGVDVSSWEERDWEIDSAFQIGVALPTGGDTWRAGLSVVDGRPPLGEFFKDSETWVSLGVWLDL